MKYRIELMANQDERGQWTFSGLVTRHDHATTTVTNGVQGIDMQAVMQLCGDAITEDIAWQQQRKGTTNALEVICDD